MAKLLLQDGAKLGCIDRMRSYHVLRTAENDAKKLASSHGPQGEQKLMCLYIFKQAIDLLKKGHQMQDVPHRERL